MAKLTLEGGLTITIEGESDALSDEDLYTQAMVTLIEEAPVGWWEKDNFGAGVLDEFSGAVLGAVTRLYAREADLLPDEDIERPLHDVLSEVVGYLKRNGRLDDIISQSTLYEDDEEMPD